MRFGGDALRAIDVVRPGQRATDCCRSPVVCRVTMRATRARRKLRQRIDGPAGGNDGWTKPAAIFETRSSPHTDICISFPVRWVAPAGGSCPKSKKPSMAEAHLVRWCVQLLSCTTCTHCASVTRPVFGAARQSEGAVSAVAAIWGGPLERVGHVVLRSRRCGKLRRRRRPTCPSCQFSTAAAELLSRSGV